MDWWSERPERGVVEVSHVWHDPDGSAWLVTFAMAELGGRLRCVGMTVRSYLKSDVGDDPDMPMPGYAVGPIERDSDEYRALVADDPAAALDTFAYKELTTPRALDAQTLRRLPLVHMLNRARESRANTLGHLALTAGEPFASGFARGRTTVKPRGRRGSMDELTRAAAVYKDACHDGSLSPTKDVARVLGVSRNVAAKLVQRCRASEIGLLPPTERGKARADESPPIADDAGAKADGPEA